MVLFLTLLCSYHVTLIVSPSRLKLRFFKFTAIKLKKKKREKRSKMSNKQELGTVMSLWEVVVMAQDTCSVSVHLTQSTVVPDHIVSGHRRSLSWGGQEGRTLES